MAPGPPRESCPPLPPPLDQWSPKAWNKYQQERRLPGGSRAASGRNPQSTPTGLANPSPPTWQKGKGGAPGARTGLESHPLAGLLGPHPKPLSGVWGFHSLQIKISLTTLAAIPQLRKAIQGHAGELQGGQCSAEQHGHSGSMSTEVTRMAPPGVVQCETCATLPCGPAAPWGFLPCH